MNRLITSLAIVIAVFAVSYASVDYPAPTTKTSFCVAEWYTWAEGMHPGSCTDGYGGQVSYLDLAGASGSWARYRVYLGQGAVRLRAGVACNMPLGVSSGVQIEVRVGGELLGILDVKGTGGECTFLSQEIALSGGGDGSVDLSLVLKHGAAPVPAAKLDFFEITYQEVVPILRQADATDPRGQELLIVQGGNNVRYISGIDNGDYAVYPGIDMKQGLIHFKSRIARDGTVGQLGGIIEFHVDRITGPKIGEMTVRFTGAGPESWTEQYTTLYGDLVDGAQGVHDLYLVFKAANGCSNGICNLDWFELTPINDAYLHRAAVLCDGMQGMFFDFNSQWQYIGGLDNGDYLKYSLINFRGGAIKFSARIASDGAGYAGNIELRLDSPTGPLLGTLNVMRTGGWWVDKAVTQSTYLNGDEMLNANGVHDLYLVSRGNGGIANFEWFEIFFAPKPKSLAISSNDAYIDDVVFEDDETRNTEYSYQNISGLGVEGRHVFVNGGVVNQTGGYNYYMKDHLGSTRVVVDENAQVIEAAMYDAYGAVTPIYRAGAENTKPKFTGKELDGEGQHAVCEIELDLKVTGVNNPGNDYHYFHIDFGDPSGSDYALEYYTWESSTATLKTVIKLDKPKTIHRIWTRIGGQVVYIYRAHAATSWPSGWEIKEGERMVIRFAPHPIAALTLGASEESNPTCYVEHTIQTDYHVPQGMKLAYFGRRYYDPEIARWTSVDPVPQFHDMYNYCGDNPTNRTDPDGSIAPAVGVYITAVATSPDLPNDVNMLSMDLASGDYVGAVGDVAGILVPGMPAQATRAGTKGAVHAGEIVLGHYPAYISKAREVGARVFSIPTNIWNKMSASMQWAANRRFLDRAIARGDRITLATSIDKIKPGSYYERELLYLIDKGYEWNKAENAMIRANK